MEIINKNPFRVAGILANSSAREVERQRGRIKAFARVGKRIDSEYDFNFLDRIDRTEDEINLAFSQLEQNKDKVNYSLFWFLNASPFDSTALGYLKNNDPEKAIEIWEKVTQNKPITASNFSSINNLSTYRLLSTSEASLKEAIKSKFALIDSYYFESFIHEVADETFSIEKKKQKDKLVDEFIKVFKSKYSTKQLIDLFDECDEQVKKYVAKKFTRNPLNNIESKIEKAKNERKKYPSKAYSTGRKLIKDTMSDLSLLQSILNSSDLKYKMIADNLANEVMQCGIDYINKMDDDELENSHVDSAIGLIKKAKSIAVSQLTIDRAKENISAMEGLKDREIVRALSLLKSIKNAYEKNKAKINREVSSMTLGFNERINWNKVNEMIENSLDWKKVSDLVSESISPSDVRKIQNINDVKKLAEYKTLVLFLFDKIGYSDKRRLSYLKYWSSSTSSTSGGARRAPRTVQTSNTTESEGIPGWIKTLGWIIFIIIFIRACLM